MLSASMLCIYMCFTSSVIIVFLQRNKEQCSAFIDLFYWLIKLPS